MIFVRMYLPSAHFVHGIVGDDDSDGGSEGDEPKAGSGVGLVSHIDPVGLIVNDGSDEGCLGEGVSEEPSSEA